MLGRWSSIVLYWSQLNDPSIYASVFIFYAHGVSFNNTLYYLKKKLNFFSVLGIPGNFFYPPLRTNTISK
jgi:hypothetical protein